MKSRPCKTPSQIVTAFTQENHDLQLNEEMHLYSSLVQGLRSRRAQIILRQRVSHSQAIKEENNEKQLKLKSMDIQDEHSIDLDVLCKRLSTDTMQGLSKSQAINCLQVYGKNCLTENKQIHLLIKFLELLVGFFGLIQIIGGVLFFIAYGLSPEDPSSLYLGIVLNLMNFVNGGVTFFQNEKSEAVMESFKNFIPRGCCHQRRITDQNPCN